MRQEAFAPARVPAPGRILSRELEARGWTQKDLAEIINRPEQSISQIINAKKQITPETAKELSEAFETSAEFWLNLETNYQLHQARKIKTDKAIKRRARLFELAPVPELVKRGWIERKEKLDELERELCHFFGISSIDETPAVLANLRHSQHRGPEESSLAAWVRQVERLANEEALPPYSQDAFPNLIDDLLEVSASLDSLHRVPQILGAYGVHFVILPHLSKTYLDGAAFWTEERPVVALTLRYDRVDNFWFTLMHELAHVALGHEGLFLDNTREKSTEDIEAKADAQALAWLIPNEFSRLTTGRLTRKRILEFADSHNRHPGIIVGCLQGEGHISYSTHRDLLSKVKPYLS